MSQLLTAEPPQVADADADVVTAVLARLRLMTGPPDPREAAQDLRRRFPRHRFTLVEDREAYDGSTARAVVVRPPGAPAISVSVAAVDELPWPLRGVVRSEEQDLLEVDGVRLPMTEALMRLDTVLFERPVMRMLIDGCLVDNALAADPVVLTDDEIQSAADGFRRAHGLIRREQLQHWLSRRGLDAEAFVGLVTRQAELAALRARVVDDDVPAWFDAHRDRLTTVTLVWTAVEPGAAGTTDPWALLQQAASAGDRCGMVRRTVGELDLDVAPVLGGTVALDVEGPAVGVVVAVHPAELDDDTTGLARRRLFDGWLDAQRAAARVTWFWGDRERTGS